MATKSINIIYNYVYKHVYISSSPTMMVWNVNTRLEYSWTTWSASWKFPVHLLCTCTMRHPMYDSEQGMRTTTSRVYAENWFQRLTKARKQTALTNELMLKTVTLVKAEHTCSAVSERRQNTNGDSANPLWAAKAASCSRTGTFNLPRNLQWWDYYHTINTTIQVHWKGSRQVATYTQ